MFEDMKPWDYFILALMVVAAFSVCRWLFGLAINRVSDKKSEQ